MITVKLEYGIGDSGSTESCITFECENEAREFAHNVLDEILDAVESGDEADNGLIRIWDDESDRDLIDDLRIEED